MKDLFERHPLPWKVDGPSCDYYWVRDAKGAAVTMVSDADETHTTHTNDQGHVVRTTIKTKRRGAEKLAAAIAALPELMADLVDAHAELTSAGRAAEPVAVRLEMLIEKLA